MADSKITALTSISTSTDPANDPLVIVDVSDTSMAATGTTKKVTLNQLLGASGTATLASATITGDLTVDTNTLKVDSTNNRVGINKATPVADLDVGGSGRFQSAGANWMEFGVNVLTSNQATGASIRSVVSSAGNPTYSWTGDSDTGLFNDAANSIGFAIGGSEGMRLNSTGLGVGVVPSAGKFEVQESGTGGGFGGIIASTATAGGNAGYVFRTGGTNRWAINLLGSAGAESLRFYDVNNSATRLLIDTSGNVISNVTGTAPTLATNSQMVFNLTSNTNLRISVRGTDGTTRTANITLA